MKEEINAHNFKEVYEMLGINLSKLGCIMLDTEPIILPTYIIQDINDGSQCNFDTLLKSYCYKAKNKERFWIDGYVADTTPHLTLMYGFLNEAKNYIKHIEILLKDWKCEDVEIEDISYFNSPYQDEEYYCLIAKIKQTPELIDGNERMKFLPHLNTFMGYKPHITIAYLIKDERVRDDFIELLKKELVGKKLKVVGLNYGGNK
jgi:2'-5' RNA ligase